MTTSTINRSAKQIGSVTIACPAAVSKYQRWMTGVGVHDQLRPQLLSLQTSTRFSKCYKILILGFVDLALMSACISHKETAQLANKDDRRRVVCVLQSQLLQLKADDSVGVVVTTPTSNQKRRRAPVGLTNGLEQSEVWMTVSGVQKRSQRSCKVCELLRSNPMKTSFTTTYFCERCSGENAKYWLCNKLRHTYKSESKTCVNY